MKWTFNYKTAEWIITSENGISLGLKKKLKETKNKERKSTKKAEKEKQQAQNFPQMFPNFSNLTFLLHPQNPPTRWNKTCSFSSLFLGILFPANVLLQKVFPISTWRAPFCRSNNSCYSLGLQNSLPIFFCKLPELGRIQGSKEQKVFWNSTSSSSTLASQKATECFSSWAQGQYSSQRLCFKNSHKGRAKVRGVRLRKQAARRLTPWTRNGLKDTSPREFRPDFSRAHQLAL